MTNPTSDVAALISALQKLSDAADEIHGSIDLQVYDDRKHEEWDIPSDREHSVNITEKQDRDLGKAICDAQVLLSSAPLAHATTKPAVTVEAMERVARIADARLWQMFDAGAIERGPVNDPRIAASLAKAREILAHIPSSTVPDGWVMVPEEPTEEMLGAGDSAIPQFEIEPDGSRLMGRDGMLDAWRAMLAAATKGED